MFIGLGKNIGESPSLSHVHLVDVKLAKVAWQALSDGIQQSAALKCLRINKCDLKIPSLDSLVPGIVLNKSLQIIDLSDNKIPDNCAGLLLKVVSGQGERLDEIVWSFGLRGELPSNLHEEGMRVYNVSGNELSFQMAKGLEKFLQNNIYL